MMIKVKHNMNYITIYKCSQKDIILKKNIFFLQINRQYRYQWTYEEPLKCDRIDVELGNETQLVKHMLQ